MTTLDRRLFGAALLAGALPAWAQRSPGFGAGT